jgi:hypothetical protein
VTATSLRTMHAFRVMLSLWGVALVVAFALVVFSTRDEPEVVCPGTPNVEGSSLRISHQLWPPGSVECEYTAPGGAVARSTHFPWLEWGVIAMFALAVGVGAGVVALTRRRAKTSAGGEPRGP